MYAIDIAKTLDRRFWKYKLARRVWDCSVDITNCLKVRPDENSRDLVRPLEWQRGLPCLSLS